MTPGHRLSEIPELFKVFLCPDGSFWDHVNVGRAFVRSRYTGKHDRRRSDRESVVRGRDAYTLAEG